MSIICEHCGAESYKYKVLCYSQKYIEEVLESHFSHNIYALLSTNLKTVKYIKAKRVCLYILHKYSAMTKEQIKKTYNLEGISLNFFPTLLKEKNPDLIALDRELGDGLNIQKKRLAL